MKAKLPLGRAQPRDGLVALPDVAGRRFRRGGLLRRELQFPTQAGAGLGQSDRREPAPGPDFAGRRGGADRRRSAPGPFYRRRGGTDRLPLGFGHQTDRGAARHPPAPRLARNRNAPPSTPRASPPLRCASWWYDPRAGLAHGPEETKNEGRMDLSSPADGDWVLVIDAADRAYPPPGSATEPGPDQN